MNKDSPEYQRVREEMERALVRGFPDGTAGLYRARFREKQVLDQILSIKGLRIEANDQTLPHNPYKAPYLEPEAEKQKIADLTYSKGRDDMLKANFRKVI